MKKNRLFTRLSILLSLFVFPGLNAQASLLIDSFDDTSMLLRLSDGEVQETADEPSVSGTISGTRRLTSTAASTLDINEESELVVNATASHLWVRHNQTGLTSTPAVNHEVFWDVVDGYDLSANAGVTPSAYQSLAFEIDLNPVSIPTLPLIFEMSIATPSGSANYVGFASDSDSPSTVTLTWSSDTPSTVTPDISDVSAFTFRTSVPTGQASETFYYIEEIRAIPEPATLCFVVSGAAAILIWHRRFR